MTLPPIGEGTFLICMALAILAGMLLGFALGYGLKAKKHSAEIKTIIRITKRIEKAQTATAAAKAARTATAAGKETAPKGRSLASHPPRLC